MRDGEREREDERVMERDGAQEGRKERRKEGGRGEERRRRLYRASVSQQVDGASGCSSGASLPL